MIRVDAHMHVWRLDRGDHDWITADLPIHGDYGLDDIRPYLENIDAVILVQSAPTEAETRYLLEVADTSRGLVRGVIGWTDLSAPDAPARIATLADNSLVKGLRPALQDIDDTYWILREEIKPALRAMAESGLCLEALIQPRHLPLMPILSAMNPDLKIVINHGAKPPIPSKELQPWADDLKRAAAARNIYCKVSGLAAQAGSGWMMNDIRPWAETIMDCFGPSRSIWGSDWPVLDLTATSYARWHTIMERFLFRYNLPDREEVMGGTAVRVYGLN